MKGLFYSAWEELGRMYRAMGGKSALPPYIILVLNFVLNGDHAEEGGPSLYVWVLLWIVTYVAVLSFTRWATGGELVLELSGGRAEWQILGGKLLGWCVYLSAGELLRQWMIWHSMRKEPSRTALLSAGLGWKPFLTVVCTGLLLLLIFVVGCLAAMRGKGRAGYDAALGGVACCLLAWLLWSVIGGLPLWPACILFLPLFLLTACVALRNWG